jgi:UDP-3-O-[3-hydroxymyristoyl] glucosamine N-acyltransferase
VRLGEIAELLNGELSGGGEVEITGVSGMEDAREGDITFITAKKQVPAASGTGASCVMVKEFFPDLDKTQLKVEDPRYAFAVLLGRFHARDFGPPGISGLAYVAEDAVTGEGVSVQAFACVSAGVAIGRETVIMPGVFIGPGVKVGERCVIYPNVAIMDGTVVGDRVVIHAGSVVGSDGFGYIQRGGRHVKVPQVGGVVIGEDVEIGACVAIDRATTGNTVIGRGAKIDNLVQVAHNVTIGEDCVVVAQVGIAGSARIGNYCMIGGQAAVADHASLEDGAMLAGRTGAMGHVKKGAYGGTPAIPHREWLKATALFGRLPEFVKRISALEEKMKNTEGGQGND